jgi:hypothetical protein
MQGLNDQQTKQADCGSMKNTARRQSDEAQGLVDAMCLGLFGLNHKSARLTNETGHDCRVAIVGVGWKIFHVVGTMCRGS